jgi:hypothetical protein
VGEEKNEANAYMLIMAITLIEGNYSQHSAQLPFTLSHLSDLRWFAPYQI